MWFYRIALRHLHWSAAVLRKFFNLVPLPTLTVVALTLVSQFTRMLAFFLPLKVIILIGSTGTPRYFPDSWAALDRDFLVVALSAATVIFYALSLFSEKLLSYTAERGAVGVVEATNKLILFSSQEEIASQAYQKLAASLATGALLAVLVILFAVIYPAFLLVALLYVLAASLFVALLGRGAEVRGELSQRAGSLSGLISGIGFMTLFAFMVMDFLLWEGVSFMVAIISLLLARQLLNRFDSVIKDAIWLSGKRLQINAIFFTGHRLEITPEPSGKKRLWSLLSLHESSELILPFLEQIQGFEDIQASQVECRWRQSGLVDMLVFDIACSNRKGKNEYYLLKVFVETYRKAALSEADLLSSASGCLLPVPELVHAGELKGFYAHLFRLPEWWGPKFPAVRKVDPTWLTRYWQVEPDRALVNRYLRSHPLLQHRLSSQMLERLVAVANGSEQQATIAEFRERFEYVLEVLNFLPLAVTNPGVPRELSFVSTDGDLVQAHLGNWALEPIGLGWPLGKSWLPKLKEGLAEAGTKRAVLLQVSPASIRLCACCGAFEQSVNRQRYEDAIELVPQILTHLSDIETNSGSSGGKKRPTMGEDGP